MGSGGIATTGNLSLGGTGLNLFANPVAVARILLASAVEREEANSLRRIAHAARLEPEPDRGKEDLAISERMNLDVSVESFNLFNVVNFAAPSLNLNSLSNFGVFTTQLNTPRRFLLGAELTF